MKSASWVGTVGGDRCDTGGGRRDAASAGAESVEVGRPVAGVGLEGGGFGAGAAAERTSGRRLAVGAAAGADAAHHRVGAAPGAQYAALAHQTVETDSGAFSFLFSIVHSFFLNRHGSQFPAEFSF